MTTNENILSNHNRK